MTQPTPSTRMFDAAWRAAAYCLHPRVISLSFLPLVLCMAFMGLLGWFFWTDALQALAQSLGQWAWSRWLLDLLAAWDWPSAPQWVAGLVLLLVTVPAVVVLCLLLVAVFMTPAIVKLVAQRRFAQLLARDEAPWWTSLGWSLGASAMAGAALLLSLPLWLFPPFGLLLPPLIWGWLTYRVMAFDALAGHASAQERALLMQRHRVPLLAMGVVCGMLGAAPTMLWALSAITIVLAPFMVALSIWVYTLVFAFASLWFAHYLLQALSDLREEA